jgi:hypothetical protein
MEYSLAIGSAKEALPHPPRMETRRRDDVHTEQSERVRLAESCSTPRDVYRKRSAAPATSNSTSYAVEPEMNSNHNPAGNGLLRAPFKPGDRVTRQGTVLSDRSGFIWVKWDEGPTQIHAAAYLEAR